MPRVPALNITVRTGGGKSSAPATPKKPTTSPPGGGKATSTPKTQPGWGPKPAAKKTTTTVRNGGGKSTSTKITTPAKKTTTTVRSGGGKSTSKTTTPARKTTTTRNTEANSNLSSVILKALTSGRPNTLSSTEWAGIKSTALDEIARSGDPRAMQQGIKTSLDMAKRATNDARIDTFMANELAAAVDKREAQLERPASTRGWSAKTTYQGRS